MRQVGFFFLDFFFLHGSERKRRSEALRRRPIQTLGDHGDPVVGVAFFFLDLLDLLLQTLPSNPAAVFACGFLRAGRSGSPLQLARVFSSSRSSRRVGAAATAGCGSAADPVNKGSSSGKTSATGGAIPAPWTERARARAGGRRGSLSLR